MSVQEPPNDPEAPPERSGRPSAGGALAGLRVLDLSIWRPGPYATQLLAELGADVVKVEPPGGDPMRAYPGLFTSLHAHKRSVVLDLHAPAGREEALALATEADVVIEGFRPGVAERLGIGYPAVRHRNPAVVYCSISGLGQDGPLATARGHDLNFQAWAGALAPDGGEPIWSPLPIADLASGTTAAFAIMAALWRRDRSGEGEQLDVAMADVLAVWTGSIDPYADGQTGGTDRQSTHRAGTSGPARPAGPGGTGGPNEHAAAGGRSASPSGPAEPTPGYGIFPTADGRFVTLGIVTEDHLWRALCEALGLAGIAACTWTERQARGTELQDVLAETLRRRDRDEIVSDLLAAGVPVAPVHDRAEMLASPHFRARGAVTAEPWADPAMGYPVRFAAHPAARTSPPPALDEHHGQRFFPRAT